MAIFKTKANFFDFGKLRSALKQTTSPMDRSGRELSREPFTPAVHVLCKPYLYKWFLSRLLSSFQTHSISTYDMYIFSNEPKIHIEVKCIYFSEQSNKL